MAKKNTLRIRGFNAASVTLAQCEIGPCHEFRIGISGSFLTSPDILTNVIIHMKYEQWHTLQQVVKEFSQLNPPPPEC